MRHTNKSGVHHRRVVVEEEQHVDDVTDMDEVALLPAIGVVGAVRAEEPEPEEAPVEVQRPFAALGDLMGRATIDEPKRQD